MNTDLNQIYLARNKIRIPKQVYMYEATFNLAKIESEKLFNKDSASLFTECCLNMVLTKLGKNMEYLKKDDLNKINYLYKCISSFR